MRDGLLGDDGNRALVGNGLAQGIAVIGGIGPDDLCGQRAAYVATSVPLIRAKPIAST